jgi:hypothetical protein
MYRQPTIRRAVVSLHATALGTEPRYREHLRFSGPLSQKKMREDVENS